MPRHAQLIHSGKKKLIIKKKFFRAIVQKDLALITKIEGKGTMLGLVRLQEPVRMDTQGFKRHRGEHQITNKEKNEWWPNTKRFYSYRIVKYFPLRKPKPVNVLGEEAVQKEFLSAVDSIAKHDLKDFIKDFGNYNPSKVANKVLADDWRIVNAWYSSIKRGKKLKISQKNVEELARKILQELLKRGFVIHKDKMKPSSKELLEKISKVAEKPKDEQEMNSNKIMFNGDLNPLMEKINEMWS